MDRLLKPRCFETDHNAPDAEKQWKYFYKTFTNFLTAVQGDENKLQLLVNHISPDIYPLIEDCLTYDQAIATLRKIYVKPPNEVYSRHLLATRVQQEGESLDSFLQALKDLSKNCNFGPVTAAQHRDEYIRDSFITGIQSAAIRTRLLENAQLDLDTMFAQARSLDTAQKSSITYQTQHLKINAMKQNTQHMSKPTSVSPPPATAAARGNTCYFCGYSYHPRYKCPAKDEICGKCHIRGHFMKVCRNRKPTSAAIGNANNVPREQEEEEDPSSKYSYDSIPFLSSILAVTNPRRKRSRTSVKMDGFDAEIEALVDTGAQISSIHPKVVAARSLKVFPPPSWCTEIALADTSLSSKVMGVCRENITVKGKPYKDTQLFILSGLCADIILGEDFQCQHESVTFEFGGSKPPLVLGSINASSSNEDSSPTPPGIMNLLAALGIVNVDQPPSLFKNMDPNMKPIKTKSRKYSHEDTKFIEQEVKRLLSEGIIEKSSSPWRAQCVVVTREGSHKKRLAIDYSTTVNQFTYLDAYPLPDINETVNKIAQFNVHTTMDMTGAYHQYEIPEDDRPYTAFEANGGLYQFCRIPFGVTNGVACFQREMDKFIADNSLEATHAYLDNITISGRDQAHHDINLQKFMAAAKKANLTFNKEKCEFSTTCLKILGSIVENGTIRPDPDRLKPLMDLTPPENAKALRRVMGFFAHYSKYIKNFSFKVRPLSQTTTFPITPEALTAFNLLRKDILDSVMGAIDVSVPFQLETDASDHTIAGVLNQSGRPVAFFSRTLQPSEVKHSAVEKEAQAIIESVRHWRHFLTGAHFTLCTDQKSVSYMFDKKHHGKIKNDKIHRWRMELSCYSFDIVHRPGIQNIPADTFSRNICAGMTNNNQLYQLHNSLCHPGVTRFYHFIKSKNLPYSIDEIREMTRSCQICANNKPRFSSNLNSHLIKATQPMERLSIDFKGPLPSNNKNTYLLDIVDEYSRFPFGYPCANMESSTIIKCLSQLFSIFGMPAYIHTDQGSNFMSKELKDFLLSKNVATSRTTSYNPEGNGQCEKLNGTLWKNITLSLKSRGLPQSCWQDVLPDALHSIRSLLCTSTNATPHERMFLFQRRSTTGSSVPTWLTDTQTALLKRHVRNKQDPLVDEVEVMEVNPAYAHVRTSDGVEKTVSLKHLSPPAVVHDSPTGTNTGNMDLPTGTSPGNTVTAMPPQINVPTENSVNYTVHASTPVRTLFAVAVSTVKVIIGRWNHHVFKVVYI